MPISNSYLGLEFENFSINNIIPCPDLITSPWRLTVWDVQMEVNIGDTAS